MKYLRRSLFVLLALFILFPVKTHAETLRWFGSKLTGVEKEIYDKLASSYKDIEENNAISFSEIEGTDISTIKAAAFCFINDYPEAYWFTGGMTISSDSVELEFYQDILDDKAEIDLEIEKAMEYVGKYDHELSKIRAINDYICQNTYYGSTVDGGQSIRGGLLKKYGNKFECAGHSKLFQILCLRNNIPCIYVLGYDHAFNYVQYNNKWYMVDVTWNHPYLGGMDSGEQVNSYDYLMRGKDAVSEFHDYVEPFKAGNLSIDYPEKADQSIVYMQDVDVNRDFFDYDYWDSTPSKSGFYYIGEEIQPELQSLEMQYNTTKIVNRTEEGISYSIFSLTLKLVVNKDFKISYRNNIKVGKAEMIITGIGRCYGSVSIPFNIIEEEEMFDDEILDDFDGEVEKITISGISHDIAAGGSVQLTASVLPKNAKKKAVKWSTSNKKVATVSTKGKVKVNKAAGGKKVTITAKATDGSGVSKSFKINVMKGAVKSVKITGAKKTLKANKKMTLKAVVKTSKGKPVNKKVKWTSGNKKYATVNAKGVVKALKAGKGKKVTITVMSTDGTNKKKSVTIKIK